MNGNSNFHYQSYRIFLWQHFNSSDGIFEYTILICKKKPWGLERFDNIRRALFLLLGEKKTNANIAFLWLMMIILKYFYLLKSLVQMINDGLSKSES